MIPIHLTQDSVGAPDMEGVDGSGYDVLKWAAPLLGWTIEFDDPTNKRLAIRNNSVTGSGYYLRSRDNEADHGADARRMAMEGFSSMTDVNTGNDGFPSVDQYWVKKGTADAGAINYRIIGTDKFFYFLTRTTTTATGYGYRLFAAGDGIPGYANELNPFIILSNSLTSTTSSQTPSGLNYLRCTMNSGASSNNSGEQAFAKNFLNSSVGIGALYTSLFLVDGSTAEMGSAGKYPADTGAIPTSRVGVTEYGGASSDAIPNRLYLPGLLNALVDIRISQQSDYGEGDTIPGISNGKDIINATLIPGTRGLDFTNSGWEHAFLFDLETDWDDW